MRFRPFAQGSIPAKLLAIMLVTAGVALLVADLAFVGYDLIAFQRQRAHDILTDAEIIGALNAAALTFDDPDAARDYLSALRFRTSLAEAAIYDVHGRVFATYRREGEPARPLPAPEPGGYRIERGDLIAFHRIERDGDHLGALYLRANLGRRDRLLRYAGIAGLVSGGSLAVAVLLLGRLQRAVSGPLLEVAAVARGVVARGDFSQRIAKRNDDEVGVLVEAFNQMMDGIQQREASLQTANEALQVEIAEHRAARDEVARLNQDLEQRVALRTAELQAANKELESFSYSVSHDLRAPLRSIDGFTLLLQTQHEADLSEEGRHYIARVRAATQRMGHLIDDLLKLSRTIRAEMTRKDVDLSALAAQVTRELHEAEPERKVTVDVAPALLAHADPELMRAVLENLLGNAWKFTSKVADAHVTFGQTLHDGMPAFFVRDNGVGFDMKYANKLFGAFQRLHSVSEYAGTGVGLANVQRIIRRHGGQVWAESVVDQGTTFYFTLPA